MKESLKLPPYLMIMKISISKMIIVVIMMGNKSMLEICDLENYVHNKTHEGVNIVSPL